MTVIDGVTVPDSTADAYNLLEGHLRARDAEEDNRPLLRFLAGLMAGTTLAETRSDLFGATGDLITMDADGLDWFGQFVGLDLRSLTPALKRATLSGGQFSAGSWGAFRAALDELVPSYVLVPHYSGDPFHLALVVQDNPAPADLLENLAQLIPAALLVEVFEVTGPTWVALPGLYDTWADLLIEVPTWADLEV